MEPDVLLLPRTFFRLIGAGVADAVVPDIKPTATSAIVAVVVLAQANVEAPRCGSRPPSLTPPLL
jgi:hypothetical protein